MRIRDGWDDWFLRLICWRSWLAPEQLVDIEQLPASFFHPKRGLRDPLIVDVAIEGIVSGMSPEGAAELYCVELTDTEVADGLSRRISVQMAPE
ncbi:hypothetical protein [Acidisphaera sp. S103]|uniref:hypothetical protein n=1 Tax=Acidisphaera sp. S103 TaxID=1747223 RepID=UPI00131AA5F3|nr:hypothetical protein [Acidisphaera sp. S103]